MIVDGHAHVFQHFAEASGHPSRAIHLSYMQKVQTRSVARIFRARDGKDVSGSVLFEPADNSWAGLRDVHFRVGNYGRLDFTIDGEDYHSQYMPVGMQQIVAPPELMLAQMDYAGVDHCVLQAGWGYGAMNDYNAFAQSQYPDRFSALLNVEEPRAYTEEALKEFDRAHRQFGLRGIYFAFDAFARHGFDIAFDDGKMEPFWSKVEASKLPVFIEANGIPSYDRAGYVANMVRLRGLMQRHGNIRWILVMGPPVGFFGKSGRWEFPDEVLAVYSRDNMWLEIMFPITWGRVWDYPYPEAQELIRDMRDKFGAAKLVWGSDMPNVERFCTYRQSLDYVRRYCPFLTASEKDAALGGNLEALLGLKQRERARHSPSPEIVT